LNSSRGGDELGTDRNQRVFLPNSIGVRLWCSRGCVQHPQSKSLELMVYLCREDRVTVMDQETVGMIARNRFAKLLQSPGCRWMRGDVAMHDAPCPNLHQEEHIESSKIGRSPRPGNRTRRWTGRDCGQTSSSSAKRSSGGLVAPVREANRHALYETRG
jgi:hypothetical protein